MIRTSFAAVAITAAAGISLAQPASGQAEGYEGRQQAEREGVGKDADRRCLEPEVVERGRVVRYSA